MDFDNYYVLALQACSYAAMIFSDYDVQRWLCARRTDGNTHHLWQPKPSP